MLKYFTLHSITFVLCERDCCKKNDFDAFVKNVVNQ